MQQQKPRVTTLKNYVHAGQWLRSAIIILQCFFFFFDKITLAFRLKKKKEKLNFKLLLTHICTRMLFLFLFKNVINVWQPLLPDDFKYQKQPNDDMMISALKLTIFIK